MDDSPSFSLSRPHPSPGTKRSRANAAGKPRSTAPPSSLACSGNPQRPPLHFYSSCRKPSFHVYVFCHLLAGLLRGIVFYAWKRDGLVIVGAALGSLLPDLIDKPLGFLISGTVGFGRIYAHTLFFLGVLLLAGAALWRGSSRRAGLLVITVAAGVLSHQLLDAMWFEPAAWYWPLFGPFLPAEIDIPLLFYILGDFLQPAEWLFAAACLFLAPSLAGMRGSRARLAPALSLVLAFFAMWVFFCAVTGSPCAITGWEDRGDNAIVTLVLLAGAVGVDRVGGVAGGKDTGEVNATHNAGK